MTTRYDEVLSRTKNLSSEERLRLADALLAEELGFGMWAHRARNDGDAATYVEGIRDASMRTPDNRLKSPDEFLKEVEAFDE